MYREFQGNTVISRLSPDELRQYADVYHAENDILSVGSDTERIARELQSFFAGRTDGIDMRILIGMALLFLGLIFPQYRYTFSHE
jgi:hypothetical protein